MAKLVKIGKFLFNPDCITYVETFPRNKALIHFNSGKHIEISEPADILAFTEYLSSNSVEAAPTSIYADREPI